MNAYARSLGNTLNRIDEILAQILMAEGAPAPLREVLQEPEEAKATAKVKFNWMDENYDLQSVSEELTEDMEAAHTKAYDKANQRYSKTMQATNTVLHAWPVSAAWLSLSKLPRHRNVSSKT